MKPIIGTVLIILILALSGCQAASSPEPAAQTPTADLISSPISQAAFPPPIASPPPPGISIVQTPQPLTEAEKARVIQIAVNSPEAQQWLKGRTDYRIIGSVDWYAISFENDKPGSWSIIGPGYTGAGLTPPILCFPGATVAMGEDYITQMQITVDLVSEKAVMADGPYPSMSSPGRIRDLTGHLPPPESPATPSPSPSSEK
jgi:hypothetical protein